MTTLIVISDERTLATIIDALCALSKPVEPCPMPKLPTISTSIFHPTYDQIEAQWEDL